MSKTILYGSREQALFSLLMSENLEFRLGVSLVLTISISSRGVGLGWLGASGLYAFVLFHSMLCPFCLTLLFLVYIRMVKGFLKVCLLDQLVLALQGGMGREWVCLLCR